MKHTMQYYETDMMGVTHHSNYIRWMEEARIEMMNRFGFPYKQLEQDGILCPVKSIKADYLKPCTFGDEVEITVSIRAFNGVVVTIAYDMRVGDEPVFTGISEHVFLTREGHFVRLKKAMPELFAALEQQLE